MGRARKRTIWSIIALACGAALPAAGMCTELEMAAQDALASLVAQKYAATVEQFHYAATVPQQARVDDRKGMVAMLRAVFNDFDGLSLATRAADLDASDSNGLATVGIFSGDESDWRAESSRYSSTRVCYRVSRKSDASFVLSFRYIHPQDRWELLDILISAPAQNQDAVTQLSELGRRLNDSVRAQAAAPRQPQT